MGEIINNTCRKPQNRKQSLFHFDVEISL